MSKEYRPVFLAGLLVDLAWLLSWLLVFAWK
jgi:hypothetical protein